MSSYVTDNNGSERIGIITYDEDGNFANTLGASFDWTNDNLLRGADFTGNVDGPVGMLAMRIRLNGGDGVGQYFFQASTNYVEVLRLATNTLRIVLKDSAGVIKINIISTVTITADGYYNILAGWNTAQDAGNHLYFGEADVGTLFARVAGDIDYTRLNYAVCSTVGSATRANADLNFLYFNPAETLDFSVEANRRKFFDSQGRPVLSPYGNGSIAGLTDPIMYLAGNFKTWHENKGAGGGMTVIGALTSPSS